MDPLLIILVIAVAAMWFMSSRAKKQQREAMSFRDNLQPGQEVMTGSGLFGTVVAVEDDVITLESTPGTQTRWLKAAISKLVEPPVEDEDDEELDDEADEDLDKGGKNSGSATGATLSDEALELEVPDDLSGLDAGDDGKKPGDDKKPDDKKPGDDDKKKPQQ